MTEASITLGSFGEAMGELSKLAGAPIGVRGLILICRGQEFAEAQLLNVKWLDGELEIQVDDLFGPGFRLHSPLYSATHGFHSLL